MISTSRGLLLGRNQIKHHTDYAKSPDATFKNALRGVRVKVALRFFSDPRHVGIER
jgi:hypothetical protein